MKSIKKSPAARIVIVLMAVVAFMLVVQSASAQHPLPASARAAVRSAAPPASGNGRLPAPPATAPATIPAGQTATPAATLPPGQTPKPGQTPAPSETPRPGQTASPAASATPCTLTFADVHPSEYFYTPVIYLACRGIVSGYADGTFRPYNNTTRAQMVKIVDLAFGVDFYTPAGEAYTFNDVPRSFPFFAVIEAAVHANIVGGYACGGLGEPCDAQNRPYFRPYSNVTRGQLSKIVVGAAGWALMNPPNASFTDVPLGSTFYQFVETATCRGIISGYACGAPGQPCDAQNRPYFRPNTNAIRGQIAKIIYGALTAGLPCAIPTPHL